MTWPPEGIAPYYSDDYTVIYNSDCREILPQLPQVDLVLTDPPYGIAQKWKGGRRHGWGNTQKSAKERNSWDILPDTECIESIIKKAKHSIIWGGNYFNLPPSRCWLIWNKPERDFSLAEAEMAWTNADNVVRVFDCHRNDAGQQHPTQKPAALMSWCLALSWTKKAGLILDPFMGSGTTLRVAKDLGRRAIGIELEEKYCEVAAKRMRQEVLKL